MNNNYKNLLNKINDKQYFELDFSRVLLELGAPFTHAKPLIDLFQ